MTQSTRQVCQRLKIIIRKSHALGYQSRRERRHSPLFNGLWSLGRLESSDTPRQLHACISGSATPVGDELPQGVPCSEVTSMEFRAL
jgi:hypothetical protein